MSQGVELTLQGDRLIPSSWALPAPSQWPPGSRAGRKSVLAESRDLCDLEKRAVPRNWRGEVAAVVYTAARITANLLMWRYHSLPVRWQLLCDAIVRPLVTGLGAYICVERSYRLSADSPLHMWARWLVFCLASFHCDFVVAVELPWGMAMFGVLAFLWEVSCNAIQMHMTNLKLRALGYRITANLSKVFLLVALCAAAAELLPVEKTTIENWVFFPSLAAVLLLQFYGLSHAAGRALCLGWHDAVVRATAGCLLINAALLIPGPVLSGYALMVLLSVWDPMSLYTPNNVLFLTLDICLQVVNVLLLSGMVGPQQFAQPMEAFQKLADYNGYGFLSKRIAFPGRVNVASSDCIVSFPGKYSEEWDEAVSAANTQDAFSLACVFLTDRASGLGQHSDNPDNPGSCWCHALYGRMPASTYLSVVDEQQMRQQHEVAGDLQQALEFRKADAEAMGQLLLTKRDQGELDWEQELAEALNRAEDRCLANCGRAPWGCRWFEEWRKNVDKAVELNQTLHVFYFESLAGHGKMAWHQLPDAKVREQVRERSGLGASQTAEVAYLDKKGLSYLEHDIREFKEIMRAAAN